MRSVLLTYDDRWNGELRLSRINVWGPVLLAVTVIAIESTRTFSSENTSGWLRPLVEAVLGRLSDTGWAEVHHLLRKTGHFTGFGGVCVAFLRAWLLRDMAHSVEHKTRWRLVAVLRAVASTAMVAAADEFHQTFLPNRTGKLSDVVLDTCGGLVACLVLWALWWRHDDA